MREHDSTRQFIAGRFVPGDGAPLTVLDPATEQPLATFAGASAAQVEEAMAAARASADAGGWAGLKPRMRADAVVRMLDHLAGRRDSIIALISRETGCPIGSGAMFAQFDLALAETREVVDLYLTLPEFEDSGQPLAERISYDGRVMNCVTRYLPLGVVTAISAYNFPFYLALWKVVPPLLAGNAVILRPSPLTPLSCTAIAEAALAAALPAGILNLVIEGGAEGAIAMTSDVRVNAVTFTGSNEVGARVMQQGGATLKRLQLELGGKSAQIYLPDGVAAIEAAAASVCLMHAGQGCILGTRILVPADRKAEVLEILARSLRGAVIGDPLDPATQMGPVMSAAQRARCEYYVAAAVEAGARIVTGGQRPAHLSRGFFFEPTVLDVPDNQNPACQDEIFGPVVAVIGYETIDEAVAIANDTAFGLGAYIYGRDVVAAAEVAKRLKAGSVFVNAINMSAHVAAGGWGRSGLGKERGPQGLRIFQEAQVFNIANFAS